MIGDGEDVRAALLAMLAGMHPPDWADGAQPDGDASTLGFLGELSAADAAALPTAELAARLGRAAAVRAEDVRDWLPWWLCDGVGELSDDGLAAGQSHPPPEHDDDDVLLGLALEKLSIRQDTAVSEAVVLQAVFLYAAVHRRAHGASSVLPGFPHTESDLAAALRHAAALLAIDELCDTLSLQQAARDAQTLLSSRALLRRALREIDAANASAHAACVERLSDGQLAAMAAACAAHVAEREAGAAEERSDFAQAALGFSAAQAPGHRDAEVPLGAEPLSGAEDTGLPFYTD